MAAASAIVGLVIGGCSYPTNTPTGGACVRTLECGPGLVCSQGHCTNDLSMFGMRHLVSLDSGLADAMRADAGDAGPPSDANLPDLGPRDAYINPYDSYRPNDAYVAPVDAFTPPVDAFVSIDMGGAG